MNQLLREYLPGLAAVALFGGLTVAMLPASAVSTVKLAILAAAVLAVLQAALRSVPEWASRSGWSPFEGSRPAETIQEPSSEVKRLREALGYQRSAIEGGPPLPLEVLRLIQPLIWHALEREGWERENTRSEDLRHVLSPLTYVVLHADPRTIRSWFDTRRPNREKVAAVVEHVLDELDALPRSLTHTPARITAV